ncbi:hypothetical protein ACLM5H_04960 [Fredinandcohnia humi]
MKKFKVTTKNKLYNGITEGVAFVNGEAIVEDEVKVKVLVHNYGYEAEEMKAKAEVKVEKETAEEKKAPTKRK